jgi:hypothetical protein
MTQCPSKIRGCTSVTLTNLTILTMLRSYENQGRWDIGSQDPVLGIIVSVRTSERVAFTLKAKAASPSQTRLPPHSQNARDIFGLRRQSASVDGAFPAVDGPHCSAVPTIRSCSQAVKSSVGCARISL